MKHVKTQWEPGMFALMMGKWRSAEVTPVYVIGRDKGSQFVRVRTPDNPEKQVHGSVLYLNTPENLAYLSALAELNAYETETSRLQTEAIAQITDERSQGLKDARDRVAQLRETFTDNHYR